MSHGDGLLPAAWDIVQHEARCSASESLKAAPQGALVDLARTIVHNMQRHRLGREEEVVEEVGEARPLGQLGVGLLEVHKEGEEKDECAYTICVEAEAKGSE